MGSEMCIRDSTLIAPSKPTRITHCSLQASHHGSHTARSKQANTDHTLLAPTNPTRSTHCSLQASQHGSHTARSKQANMDHTLLAPSKPTRITHSSLKPSKHVSHTARSKQANTEHTTLAPSKPTRITHCLLKAQIPNTTRTFCSLCNLTSEDRSIGPTPMTRIDKGRSFKSCTSFLNSSRSFRTPS